MSDARRFLKHRTATYGYGWLTMMLQNLIFKADHLHPHTFDFYCTCSSLTSQHQTLRNILSSLTVLLNGSMCYSSILGCDILLQKVTLYER